MLASDVIGRVRPILQDQAGVRWPDSELCDYIGDAQQQIVVLAPAATGGTFVFQLTPNSTRQKAPVDCFRVLDIHRNMGLTGAQPGRVITMSSRASLGAMDRDWHMEASDEVELWAYDPDMDRSTFWVYPAPSSAIQVEATYSQKPLPVTAPSSPLSVSEQHINPLIDWVLFRAFSKDADYGGNLQRAQTHAQAFAVALGAKAETLQVTDPNRRRRGGETGGQV